MPFLRHQCRSYDSTGSLAWQPSRRRTLLLFKLIVMHFSRQETIMWMFANPKHMYISKIARISTSLSLQEEFMRRANFLSRPTLIAQVLSASTLVVSGLRPCLVWTLHQMCPRPSSVVSVCSLQLHRCPLPSTRPIHHSGVGLLPMSCSPHLSKCSTHQKTTNQPCFVCRPCSTLLGLLLRLFLLRCSIRPHLHSLFLLHDCVSATQSSPSQRPKRTCCNDLTRQTAPFSYGLLRLE